MSTVGFLSTKNEIKCDRCGGRLIEDLESNETICSKCGMVMYEKNNSQSTPNISSLRNLVYTTPENQTSIMTYGTNLPSTIDHKNVDAFGHKISAPNEMEKLRRLNKIAIADPKTRSLNKAIMEIIRITELMNFKGIVAERACYIYQKAVKNGLIKGRSITGIAAASIFIACTELGIPSSIDEIKRNTGGLNKKNILHYYKLILKQLKMNLTYVGPTHVISSIAKKAGLSGKTQRKALEILEQVKNDSTLTGKRPNSLAAAALYYASMITNEKATQLQLANAADLTPMTIRKRYLELSIIYKTDRIKVKELDTKLDSLVIPQKVVTHTNTFAY